MTETSATSATSATEAEGNTNTSAQARKWCFTLNNYTQNEYDDIVRQCDIKKWKYIIGKEKGKQETPHLQGFIANRSAIRFKTVKTVIPRGHIEKARGTDEQNYKYCSKDGNFITNLPKPKLTRTEIKDLTIEQEYKNVIWKPWQAKVLELVETKADKRKIHWFWEPTGNTGKSYLCKYLAGRDDTIICEGKKDNIFNQVNCLLEKGITPKIILLDIPRSCKDYVNYGAIEQLKNGMMYSGKYEGGKCIFPIPVVIALANQLPEIQEMSEDRWDIIEINE